jgi:signal transduction histidine kinase
MLNPNPERIKLNEIINEVVRLQQVFALSKNIQLINNCTEEMVVYADKEMMMTVIRNLLSNAIKFTMNNGEVQINKQPGNDIVIGISDNGLGMSNDVVKKLFAINSTYTTPGTNNEEGTGLGLKLTSEFINKNKGKIWVESTKGKGSTFFIKLSSKEWKVE